MRSGRVFQNTIYKSITNLKHTKIQNVGPLDILDISLEINDHVLNEMKNNRAQTEDGYKMGGLMLIKKNTSSFQSLSQSKYPH